MVILGTPTAESTRLCAMTVTEGDPAWAGALGGKALGLPVYHITEPEIKTQIEAPVYQSEVGLAEMALDVEAIAAVVRESRQKKR